MNATTDQQEVLPPHTGLCASCAHVHVVTSARGSVFYLCRKSAEDPAFRKYPVLPVLQCRGYERAGAAVPAHKR